MEAPSDSNASAEAKMEAKMEAAIATIDRILVAAHPAHHHDQQQNPNAYVSPQPSPDATLRHKVGVTVRPSELRSFRPTP